MFTRAIVRKPCQAMLNGLTEANMGLPNFALACEQHQDYIKALKHGYGKATDHASRELRWGRLSREEGFTLIKKFQELQPSDSALFSKWLDISEEELFSQLEKFRNPLFWEKSKDKWTLKHHVLNTNTSFESFPTQTEQKKCLFTLTKPKVSAEKEYTYKLIEKGFVLDV